MKQHSESAAISQAPLAERLRPPSLDDVVGQPHLIGDGKPLRRMWESGKLYSMVLWGPPGSGKTTLARLLAHACDANLHTLSAVTSGVKDIREAIASAREPDTAGQGFVLFVDEVHRFNKAQQDAFLPHIEDGTITFIGATTENPAFELNTALLSRLRVFVLKALPDAEILRVIERAVQSDEVASAVTSMSENVTAAITAAAAGDARQALTLIEMSAAIAGPDRGISVDDVNLAVGRRTVMGDKRGDAFYDLISAFHKSVRGSDADAALYWFARMLEAGVTADYVARRLLRIASEDIGNADPRALAIANDAWEAWRKLGAPEGELAIAQAAVFLACAAKSNAVYNAFNAARDLAKNTGDLAVPPHLRNAPTQLAKREGHGRGYRYDHDEGGHAAGQRFFPDRLAGTRFYYPVDRGMETKINEKLAALRSRTATTKDSQ